MEKSITDDPIASVRIKIAGAVNNETFSLVGTNFCLCHISHLDLDQVGDPGFRNSLIHSDFSTVVLTGLDFVENLVLASLVPNQYLIGNILSRSGFPSLGVAHQQDPILDRGTEFQITTFHHLECLLGKSGLFWVHQLNQFLIQSYIQEHNLYQFILILVVIIQILYRFNSHIFHYSITLDSVHQVDKLAQISHPQINKFIAKIGRYYKNKPMAKYKIEREYIFSNQSYNEINDFLQEYKKIDLKAVRDQKGNTALHQAAYNCSDIRILRRYLEYMEKYCSEFEKLQPQERFREFVNCQNQDGLTALHFASYKGNFKALELLCANGADYTKQTKSGQNVLHLAAQGGMVESFIYFQAIIDINCRDSKQSTPLHWASYMNNQSIVTFLLAQPGVDINAQDEKLQTPLHLATAYGHTKITKKLLRAGADRKLVNGKDQTALKIARDNQFQNIERILNDQYGCIDGLKLYLNLKTVYKPETRSISKPILYILSMTFVIFLRMFLLELEERYKYFSFIQYGFFGLIYILYISLIFAPKRKRPQKYIDFLHGNMNMKKVCLTCALLKPPRSLHCDICKKCVQAYDHHCFWINNCVGRHNLGRFISFILIFQIFLLYMLGLSILVLINYYSDSKNFIYSKEDRQIFGVLAVYGLGIFSLGFSFPMIALIIVHIKNLFLNKTTYQRFTKDKVSNLTESTSHLLESQMQQKKQKNYSFSNVIKMCRGTEAFYNNETIIMSRSSQN